MQEKSKNLLYRSVTGLLIVVTIIACIKAGVWTSFLLFGIVTLVGIKECIAISQKMGKKPSILVTYLAGAAMYATIGIAEIFEMESILLPLCSLIMILALVGSLYRKSENTLEDGMWALWPSIYVSVPLSLLVTLEKAELLLPLFIFIWSSDVMAYVVGSLIGKHKLFPKWSPSKSWEGAIGGFCAALLAAFIYASFAESSVLGMVVLAGMISVFGVLGDLVESMAKRLAGLKDSGKTLPGHGGILDRFDSVFVASPIAVVLLQIAKIIGIQI